MVSRAGGRGSYDRVQPTLSVGLRGDCAEAFRIAEFTVNPFFVSNKATAHESCDLWIEFVLRNDGDAIEHEALPQVEIQMRDLSPQLAEPVTNLQQDSLTPLDINLFCYSEIWSAFIPAADGRGDFMRTGYKSPRRLVGDRIDFTQAVRELQVADKSALPLAECISDLSARLLLLTEVGLDTAAVAGSQVTVPEGLGYSGTRVVKSDVPSGGFAYSRAAWTNNGSDPDNTIFPCSANSEISGLTSTLKITPIANREALKHFRLGSGQSICFWILFRRAKLARPGTDGFTFQLDVIADRPIEFFNSFFRVPCRYRFREGTLTELKRYAAPPKLFTIWDRYNDGECYSYHGIGISQDLPLKINCDFVDITSEINRTHLIFLAGLLVSIVTSVFINVTSSLSVYSEEGITRFDPLRPFRYPELGILFATNMLSTAFLVISIIMAYRGILRTAVIVAAIASVVASWPLLAALI